MKLRMTGNFDVKNSPDDLARQRSSVDASVFAPDGKQKKYDREPIGRRTGSWMSKTILNFIVDTVLLSLVVSLLLTAAVLRFVFPAPSTSAGWILWGFDYDAWSNFQFGLVAVIGLVILLHVMLHWSWVCGVVVTKLLKRSNRVSKVDDGQQTLWGVGMLIVVVNVIGLLLGLAYLMVQSPVGQ
jgi:hypothetical protein